MHGMPHEMPELWHEIMTWDNECHNDQIDRLKTVSTYTANKNCTEKDKMTNKTRSQTKTHDKKTSTTNKDRMVEK